MLVDLASEEHDWVCSGSIFALTIDGLQLCPLNTRR
jgi:hypothetical protein